MFAISILSVVLFAMIFMIVNAVYAILNAVYAILDKWNYCTLRNWVIILFTSLFAIILWVLFLV